ncbi:MAG: hypothetical protein QNJ46_01325 [Leptolyngbyaceae cyanobacterium MO_188.B28]|nr:hypothetical protein [Leptolyngbyaceae cyanobacterium MO_188.B28]
MVQLKQRFQSFEEYLSYDDGTDNLLEGAYADLATYSGEESLRSSQLGPLSLTAAEVFASLQR